MKKGHLPEAWYQKCVEYHVHNYPAWWQQMSQEWHADLYRNHMWMTGSSSYWFRMGQTMWAIDPIWTVPGVFETLLPDLKQDMAMLDFVLLTHEHGDHFAPDQIEKLRTVPTKWVVPACMETVFRQTGVPEENCIFLQPGDEIQIKDVCIEAYQGHHSYLDGRTGPGSLMYVLKTADKTLFFPGDIRDYLTEFIPQGRRFDAVFMNMYLGQDACAYPFSQYYQAAAEYAAAMPTQTLYIGHLYGFHFGHADLIWNFTHAGAVQDGLFCLRPDMETTIPRIGRRYEI